MSLALYRIYRPSRLSEVIGQEHVTQPLARALSGNNVHHAFLFSGPRGCGKTSTARILARSLICEQGPTPDPCGQCEFCVALAPNGPGLVDVIELDAASHGGVDDTRELRERAAFVPAQARYKIYIIDEAHMVSKDGFNALLKLIEEPPDHLKFIFATTEVDKVIPTIRSRTFNYAFRLVPSRQLQQNLSMICDSEGVKYEPGALSLVARASGGSVRDAQSIMGQLIAGSGSEGLRQAEVGEQLGVTDEALLDDVVGAVAERDGAGLFSAVNGVVESGHDVRRFVTDLLHQIRDLLLITHAGEAATDDVLDVSADRREVLFAQAQQFGAAELTRLAEVVSDGLTHVKGSTSPRLQLEVLVARLLIPAADTNPEGLLARIEVLERRLSALASGPVRPAPHSAAPIAARPPGQSMGSSPAPPEGSPQVGAAPESAPGTVPSGHNPSPAASHSPTPGTERTATAPEPTGTSASDGSTGRSGRSGPPRRPAMTSLGTTVRSGPAPDRESRPAQPQPSQTVQSSETSPSAREQASSAREQTSSADHRTAVAGRDSKGQELTIEQVRSIWPNLMSLIREQSRVAAASWEGAEPTRLADGVLDIRLPTQGQEVSIRSSRRDLAMRTLLVERFRIDVQINPTTVDPGQPDLTPDVPADDDPDLGSDDLSGVDLIKRELGATQIGETEGG